MSTPHRLPINISRSFTSLYIQATGFNFDKDRIVGIGAYRFEPNGTYSTFESYARPEFDVHDSVLRIHGIDKEEFEQAESLRVVLRNFMHFLVDADVCAYNIASFVWPMLEHCTKINQITIPPMENRRFVDPARIFQYYQPPTLDNAFTHYTGENRKHVIGPASSARDTTRILLSQIEQHNLEASLQPLEKISLGHYLDFDNYTKRRARDGQPIFATGRHAGTNVVRVAREDPGYIRNLLGKRLHPQTRKYLQGILRATELSNSAPLFM